MTDTDQLIDEIMKSWNENMQLREDERIGLSDILHTHLAGKLILDRSKVEEMIEKRKNKHTQILLRDSSELQAITIIVINQFLLDIQSLLIPNQKQ